MGFNKPKFVLGSGVLCKSVEIFRKPQSAEWDETENKRKRTKQRKHSAAKQKEPVDFPPALILRLLNIFSFQKFKILYFLFGC
ncbi:MAG: hypothetical protein ACLVD7_02395 [[Clostridium] leptum]|nr:hypothetical protein DWW99_06395 [[Clostridium] leptum]